MNRVPLTPHHEAILNSLDVHINALAVEQSGGKFEFTETDLVARFPGATPSIDSAEAALAMTTLSSDLFVVTPAVEVDRETGEFLISLSLDDVPSLNKAGVRILREE